MKLSAQICTVIAVVIILSPLSYAQDAGSRASYTRGGWAGARYVALGKTGEVLANDVFSIYWNPAGLTELIGKKDLSPEDIRKKAKDGDVSDISEEDLFRFSGSGGTRKGVFEFGASAAKLDIEREAGFAGVAFSFFNGIMGAGAYSIISTGIETTDETGERTGETTYAGSMGMLAYAWDTDLTAIGIAFKGLYERIGEDEFAGAGLDVGVQLYTLPFLKIGFVIQDIGTFLYPVKDSTGVEKRYDFAMPTLRLGAAFISDTGVTLSVSGRKKTEQEDAELGLGVEYAVMKTLSVCLGLDGEEFSTGFVFSTGFLNISYAVAIDRIDYGYNNILSLKMIF